MAICYYCEETEVVKKRYGQPACEDCLEEEVYSSKRSNQMLPGSRFTKKYVSLTS